MKKYIVLLLLLIFPLNVLAEDDFSILCDKTDKINLNEQIVCRVSVKSDFLYNQINFENLLNDGFEVIDIRSNYEKRWNVDNKNGKVIVNSEEIQSDLQEFGIILLKAKKSGNYELKLQNISLVNTFTNDSKLLDDVLVNLKVISSDNLLKEITINDVLLDGFSSNITTYTVNIKDDQTVNIRAISNNEFATIKGTGEFSLDKNISKFIFPIVVKSEDGITKIYSIYLNRENFDSNNIDKTLKTITIKNDKGNNLLIDFNKDIYEYNLEVDINTKYLDIKPELNNESTSYVKNYGEQKVELTSGNNIVIIKVKDEEGQVQNYVLNITKPLANKSSNNYIKSLQIKNHIINFSKRVKNYTINIKSKERLLDIIPILDDENARYIITGNSDLKDGSVIKIIVTAENEEKQIYKINIKVKKTNYSLLVFLMLIIGGIAYLIYRNKDKAIKYINALKKKMAAYNKLKKKNRKKKKTGHKKAQSSVKKSNNKNKSSSSSSSRKRNVSKKSNNANSKNKKKRTNKTKKKK